MAFPGGFREYMAVKRQKLELQGNEVAVASSQSTILAGVVLYFDGYLGSHALSMIQLKELTLVNGARVRDKLEGEVTHIIATQVELPMTDSKMLQWKKPVVKPEWLLDSIKATKLLSWLNYRLYTNLAPSQPTLLGRFGRGASRDLGAGGASTSSSAPYNQDSKQDSSLIELGVGAESAESADGPGQFASSQADSGTVLESATSEEGNDGGGDSAEEGIVQGEDDSYGWFGPPDCFFASVALRDRPHLHDKSVAIAHSAGASGRSTSEIASCNYAARASGIRNGMSIGRARSLCKDLHVLPYEFDKYDACSKALYRILLKYGDEVQAVSCDEAYVDVTSHVVAHGQEVELAEKIRAEIRQATEGCPASIGIGGNCLLARMATKRAKPDGVFFVNPETVREFLDPQPADDLPGVGGVLGQKLAAKNIKTCKDLAAIPLSTLQRDFGAKTGTMLHNYARGIDNRPLENKGRQSVGAEVNWGVRFETQEQVDTFLEELCGEVEKRLKAAAVKGKLISLKVKRRRYDGEPEKVLGCGDCDNLSRSANVANALDRGLYNECAQLLRELRVEPTFVRGIGVHVSRLENASGKQMGGPAALSRSQPMLAFPSVPTTSVKRKRDESSDESEERIFRPPRTPPPRARQDFSVAFEDIDMAVLRELPEDIQAELAPAMAAGQSKALDRTGNGAGDNMPVRANQRELDMGQLMPTPSRVDPDVLNALPGSIRKELEFEMQRRNGGGGSSKAPPPAARKGKGPVRPDKGSPGGNRGKIKSLPKPLFKPLGPQQSDVLPTTSPVALTLPAPPPGPQLGGESDIAAVRKMLEDWIRAFPRGPDEDDIAAVEVYLSDLVEDMELETADVLLGWLRRRVGMVTSWEKGKGKLTGGWKEAVGRLAGTVQGVLKNKHGCGLKSLTHTTTNVTLL
ncbi:deoxycytidyl transferase [Borealophlyctis nickersoniae]|nr:deoxycytidyl transferase [Borealophlyctis nickersoniae]